LKRNEFQEVLEAVAAGQLGVDEAIDRLRAQGVEDLGFARLDTDRERRTGMAEAIFAPGKTDEQLAVIVERCLDAHGKVLVTRLEEERANPLLERFDQLRYHSAGRILEARPDSELNGSPVGVVSAGTSDLPVAEEAAVVLEHLGSREDLAQDRTTSHQLDARTASITGAWTALAVALHRLTAQGSFEQAPILDRVAAVSVGIVDGVPLLDLPYEEDARAEVDMNVVATGGGKFVEVQGTAEGEPFDREQLTAMTGLAMGGIAELGRIQDKAIAAAAER